ncbi:MAG: alpha/beta hydrolase, partial [Chloroflexaceae bacterium]|nr:alpha/beta hydrolase [Chloroflexaceae bacterium]
RRGPRKEEEIAEWLRVRKQPLLEGKEPKEIAYDIAKTLTDPAVAPQAFAHMRESIAALRKDSYLKTLDSVTRYESFPPFDSVQVPTLALTGQWDRIAPPELVRDMAQALPNAQFVVLANTGHMSNIEQPDAFNTAVLQFLLKHKERTENQFDNS